MKAIPGRDSLNPAGKWRVIDSNSRFFPVQGVISIDRAGGLRVFWEDLPEGPPLKLFESAELSDQGLTRSFRRGKEEPLLGAAVKVVPDLQGGPPRRMLVGFLLTSDGRADRATGVWVAEDDDPKDDGAFGGEDVDGEC
jgi:hypothetical protein